MSLDDDLVRRTLEYTRRRGRGLGKRLGAGAHGIVFAARIQPENEPPAIESAIKVHRRESDYCRERDVYLRLRQRGVRAVLACNVPELVAYDDQLWAIEMTVVMRPFVLDFAGAFLNEAPTFPEEVLAEWRAEKAEQFGGHWPEAQAVLAKLQTWGIFMVDANPGNISFGD